MVLTGNKDADLEIMKNLDDRSLLNLCLVYNRYVNELCSNNDFWRNRFIEIFGSKAANYKPVNRTWKQHYLTVIMYLDELTQPDGEFGGDPFMFFSDFTLGEIGSGNFYEKITESIANLDERYRIGYWLLNLGDSITISYPVDRYEDIEPIVKEYKSCNHFTPAQVVKIISDFYEEPITAEELLEQQEVDNPHAIGLTVDDANRGLIKRKDLVNMFFEGLDEMDGMYIIMFGS